MNDDSEKINREIRSFIDVTFEALSHIQASLETNSEEKRAQAYRKFKESLYDRFEYLLEKRKNDIHEKPFNDGTMDKDDTLEKLWPKIMD